MLKKIVILGPESTGKSTLCRQLAQHFGCLWCPEYAREYLTTHGKDYTYNDLLNIAQGQLALEDKYTAEAIAKGHKYLFIDTNQYVMRVWCEYVFGNCHNWILNKITELPYSLYLLCNIDLPWTADELREYPNEKPRIELFNIYKEILTDQKKPWSLISGTNEERLKMAVAQVDTLKIQ
jgi:NadR type nicotinamide-nucleotide adenylyltransferase